MSTEMEHLLDTLIEECAEVIQRVTKAKRFGLLETQQGQELNNLQRIRYEMNDLRATVELLDDQGVNLMRDNEQIILKKDKVRRYMRYAREIGKLE